MSKREQPVLTYSEQLRIIEKFSIRVAQAIVGGTETEPGNPDGDLVHDDGTFSEVKGASESGGAIIRRKQLRTHCAGKTRNYVVVYRENRIWRNRKWEYITLRNAKTQKELEKLLFELVTEVAIVDKFGVRDLYRKLRRRKQEQQYEFRTGRKVYIKMRPVHFRVTLILCRYQIQLFSRPVTVGARTKTVGIIRIPSNVQPA